MKRIFALFALLPLPAVADQMVIDGMAIRDGDSLSRLIKYAGQPIAKGYGSVCLNRDCSSRGSAQTWIYLYDDIQYTVSVRNNRVVAIDWKHAN